MEFLHDHLVSSEGGTVTVGAKGFPGCPQPNAEAAA